MSYQKSSQTQTTKPSTTRTTRKRVRFSDQVETFVIGSHSRSGWGDLPSSPQQSNNKSIDARRRRQRRRRTESSSEDHQNRVDAASESSVQPYRHGSPEERSSSRCRMNLPPSLLMPLPDESAAPSIAAIPPALFTTSSRWDSEESSPLDRAPTPVVRMSGVDIIERALQITLEAGI